MIVLLCRRNLSATWKVILNGGLIDNSLQAFLLELGKGFAFVARQQLLTTEKTKTS